MAIENKIEAPLQAVQRAVNHLLAEIADARHARDTAIARIERFGESVDLLIEMLPLDERDSAFSRLEELRSSKPRSARGGEVFGNVISLFKQAVKPEWSAPEVQAALADKGLEADPKAVQNAINYLARTGRLLRVARGRYAVRDAGISIDVDEIDTGTHWRSEHDV